MEYYKAKNLIQKLLEEECKKEKIDISVFSLGRLSYFNSSYFKSAIKKDLKLICSKKAMGKQIASFSEALILLMLPLHSGGFYNYKDQSLVVFLNDVGIPIISNNILMLLYTAYHELYHAIYHAHKKSFFDSSNFNQFACNLEDFLQEHCLEINVKYLFQHDSFMSEILASQYGIAKTGEYINNHPNEHFYNIQKLNRLKKRFQKKYQNYNLSLFLEIIIQAYPDCLKIEDFDKSFFSLFLNDDGTFKDINSLTSSQFQHIDPRIINAFLNTPSFLRAQKNQTFVEEENHSKTK